MIKENIVTPGTWIFQQTKIKEMGKNRKLLGTDLGVEGIVGQPKDYETAKLERESINI